MYVGLSRCYTNEAAAQATCPTEEGIREGKFKEFLLIRKYTYILFLSVPLAASFWLKSEKTEWRFEGKKVV